MTEIVRMRRPSLAGSGTDDRFSLSCDVQSPYRESAEFLHAALPEAQ